MWFLRMYVYFIVKFIELLVVIMCLFVIRCINVLVIGSIVVYFVIVCYKLSLKINVFFI